MITVFTASRLVLKSKEYLLLFLLLTLGFLWLLIYIPSSIIPGNDFSFQLGLLKGVDWILLILISTLTSLLLVFNLYRFKLAQEKRIHLKRSNLGLIAGPMGGLLATLTCAACALSVLGIVSFSTLVFLTQYRIYLSFLTIGIVLISLYYSSEVILDICKRCKV